MTGNTGFNITYYMTVSTSLKNLDGVVDVQVTLEPPQAVVRFDPKRIQFSALTNATAQKCYDWCISQHSCNAEITRQSVGSL